jgi:HD-GYP domain-containing protein (c-di-GMP phosphodiesterase class II)
MEIEEYGIVLKKNGQVIEKVSSNSLEIGLMSSFDGTEVIHHKLSKNSNWALGPDDGWNALEFIYILSGELILILNQQKKYLKSGDYLKAIPIKKDCFFTTETGAEFLYITSQPVFHHYSNTVQKFKNLAVAVEEKDGYTAEHCSRIMNLSMIIGKEMNLDAKALYQLNLGAFLHDIGKIKIPDNILNKPGSLTDKEWATMKKHPSFGRLIIEESNFPTLLEAAPIVEQHHERFNGSGYPNRLSKDDILIGSYIVAVVDSFDAMTTDRVYRKGMSNEEAFSEIQKGKETLYHPDVVDIFFSINEKIT